MTTIQIIASWVIGLAAFLAALVAIWKLIKKGFDSLQSQINEPMNLRFDNFDRKLTSLITTQKNNHGKYDMIISDMNHKNSYITTVQTEIMETIPIYWFKTDARGFTIEVSPQLCELLGYSESELMGWGWSNHIVTESKDRIMKAVKDSVEYKQPFEEPIPYKKGDGKIQNFTGKAKFTGDNYFGFFSLVA